MHIKHTLERPTPSKFSVVVVSCEHLLLHELSAISSFMVLLGHLGQRLMHKSDFAQLQLLELYLWVDQRIQLGSLNV